ncbi:hypothetical protein D3C84_1229550 [compost metagenome]
MYVHNLADANIYVDGAYVEAEDRILDIRVKPGQKVNIDIDYLNQITGNTGILINVEEF